MIKIFTSSNLKFNAKKSGIMPIRNFDLNISEKILHKIPIIKSYKFLGVEINHNGSILSHLLKI